MSVARTAKNRRLWWVMPARRSPPPWSVAEQGVSNKRQMWPPGQKQRQQPDRRFASALRTSAFPKVTTTSLLNQTGSAPSRIIINSEMVMSRMMASSQCWGCDAHGCNCSGKNHFCDVCHDFLLREWRNKAMLLGRLDYVAANSITLSWAQCRAALHARRGGLRWISPSCRSTISLVANPTKEKAAGWGGLKLLLLVTIPSVVMVIARIIAVVAMTVRVMMVAVMRALARQPVTIKARSWIAGVRLGGRAHYGGGAQQRGAYGQDNCSFCDHRNTSIFTSCPHVKLTRMIIVPGAVGDQTNRADWSGGFHARWGASVESGTKYYFVHWRTTNGQTLLCARCGRSTCDDSLVIDNAPQCQKILNERRPLRSRLRRRSQVPEGWRRRQCCYCTVTPARLTTSAHRAISTFTNGVISAIGMWNGSPAAAVIRFITIGSARAFSTSLWSLTIIGCGVFFGAQSPNQT